MRRYINLRKHLESIKPGDWHYWLMSQPPSDHIWNGRRWNGTECNTSN